MLHPWENGNMPKSVLTWNKLFEQFTFVCKERLCTKSSIQRIFLTLFTVFHMCLIITYHCMHWIYDNEQERNRLHLHKSSYNWLSHLGNDKQLYIFHLEVIGLRQTLLFYLYVPWIQGWSVTGSRNCIQLILI
jgi:hypothetical protein